MFFGPAATKTFFQRAFHMPTDGQWLVDNGGGDEGFQFLAVRITDVTKLPKATTKAPSINFQEIP